MHHVFFGLAVAGETKTQQLVKLNVNTTGRSGKVEGVGVSLTAKVGHRDRHVFAEVLTLPPYDPPGATA